MKTLKQTYCILIVLFLVLGISHIAAAQADTTQAEVPKIASARLRVDTSELSKLWFEAMRLLDNKEFVEANLKLLELDLKKVEVGLQNLPDYSVVLIKHANRLRKQGQLPIAAKLLDAAKKLSPEFAGVYFALARIRLSQNIADVYGVARELLKGFILKYKDIHTILVTVNNGVSFLLVSGIITGLVFVLFSFAYYRRAIFYTLKEVLPIPFPAFIANIFGWVLLGVITLTLGIFWGVLFLVVLLSLIGGLESASKWILQIFLVFGSLLGGLLIVVSMTYTASEGEYLQTLRRLSYGDYSPRAVKVLQKRLQEKPNEPYALFGLAYIAKNTGDVQAAIDTYEMLAEQYRVFPDRAAVQNNLGVLYHLRFRKTKDPTWYTKAEEAYSAAMRYSPTMFEPRYNIGQLLLSGFTQSQDANQQIAAARKMDNDRFVLYSGYLEHGVFTVDAPISMVALLKKVYNQDAINAGSALANKLWASGSRFENPLFFSAASFVLLLITSFAGTKKKVNYCQMCGDPYAMKSKKNEEQSKFCTQCTYIFKKKTVVKPEKRAKKLKQIDMRQKIRGLIAKIGSLCIPGAGQIYFGYMVKGIVLSFIFYLGVVIFLLKIHTRLLLEAEGSSGSSLPTLIISILLVVGAYLFNLSDILKLSPKNQ